ncbi:MAG: hypothetical protein NVSMB43_24430 [Pseudarthrobacter sp.]
MDRTTLNIVPALRLLLVGGLFAVFWIIFGAGSAHAAAPPPGERSHTSDGLVPSLTAPVKPLITTIQPRTEPAPPITTAAAPIPGPAPTAPPVGGTAPAATPVRPATAPVTKVAADTVQPLLAPLTAPVTQLVAGTVQPLLAPVTGLAGAAVAPLTAPVTTLVTDTVQPLLAAVTGLAGSVLTPIANPVDAITGPVTGLITGTALAPALAGPVDGTFDGSPAAAAASPVAPVRASTSPGGGGHATPTVETRRTAVFTARPATFTVFHHQFMGIVDGSVPRGAASMDDGGPSPQSPSGLPFGNEPATAPVLSTWAGGAGASGPTGSGAQAAADLSYRFVLPMNQGGEGSLFSFVLPGSPEDDPGFSPD